MLVSDNRVEYNQGWELRIREYLDLHTKWLEVNLGATLLLSTAQPSPTEKCLGFMFQEGGAYMTARMFLDEMSV